MRAWSGGGGGGAAMAAAVVNASISKQLVCVLHVQRELSSAHAYYNQHLNLVEHLTGARIFLNLWININLPSTLRLLYAYVLYIFNNLNK